MRDKQGFTLLELLICFTIFTTFSMMNFIVYRPVSFDAERFVLESLSLQLDSMVQRETCTKVIQGIKSTYNLYGHPSYCETYHFIKNDVIVHLGWGRISVR